MEARIIRRSLITVAVGLAMGSAGVAQATNGYFAHGYGIKAKGMGGVGMAISQDAYAPGINPAGIAGMESRIDGSLAYFRPERSYEAGEPQMQMGMDSFPIAPGKVDSNSKNFFIPSIGYVQQIDESRSWGIALLGNGGLNTNYPGFANPMCEMNPQTPTNTGTFCAGSAGVNLEQMAIIPTYAQKFADGRVSVGVSPIISYQRFEAKGIASFGGMSVDPQNLSDNGTDSTWGYGAQVGLQAEVADGVHLGASYRSKIRNSDFDDYSGLFADGGSFDVPSTWGLGVAVEVTPSVTVAADYQRINYSDVDAVSNRFENLFMGMQMQDPSYMLGGKNGPGFGWRDISIFKIGAQFDAGNGWTWRVGYNRGQNPVRDSEVLFNILAPAVMEDHLTAGFTKELSPNSELSFSAMYAPKKSVTGQNPLDGQDITLEMRQYELEVGYAYRF